MRWFQRRGRSFPWRRKAATNYEKIIAEVLLKQTRADMVAAFFPEFIARYPSWAKLAEATADDLKHRLQPLGLWRQRATAMNSLAAEMARRRGRFPVARAEIEAIPGIGQYTASAVLLFCHQKPEALLDVNMARVLERYFGPRKLADIRRDPYLQALARQVVATSDPIAINWAILDLGALVCRPHRPLCDECPLVRGCNFGRLQIIKIESEGS